MASRVEKNKRYIKDTIERLADVTKKKPTEEDIIKLVDILVNDNPYIENLDIPKREIVCVDYGENKRNVKASHVQREKKIEISKQYIQDICDRKVPVGKLFITVFHESAHARQHEIINSNASDQVYVETMNNAIKNILSEDESLDYLNFFAENFGDYFAKITGDMSPAQIEDLKDEVVYGIYYNAAHEVEARKKGVEWSKGFVNNMLQDENANGFLKITLEDSLVHIDGYERTENRTAADTKEAVDYYYGISKEEIVDTMQRKQRSFDRYRERHGASLGEGLTKDEESVYFAIDTMFRQKDVYKLLICYQYSLDNPMQKREITPDGKWEIVKSPNDFLNTALQQVICEKIKELPPEKQYNISKAMMRISLHDKHLENVNDYDLEGILSDEDMEEYREKREQKILEKRREKAASVKNAEEKQEKPTPATPVKPEEPTSASEEVFSM